LSVSSKIIFLYGQPLLKPSGNAIVPSENAKNRPEMQHDGVNFISAPFFLFPGGNIHFRLDDLVFVLGKMVGEKKDLQGF